MTNTVTRLIKDCLKLIGYNQIGYQDSEGEDFLRSVEWAKDLASQKQFEYPYIGTNTYTFSELASIAETVPYQVVVIDGTFEYPLRELDLRQYTDTQVASSADGLPLYYYWQKPSKILTFPKGSTYTYKIYGITNLLLTLTKSSDLSNVPRFLYSYFQLELAYKLALFYRKPWSPELADALRTAEEDFYINGDMTVSPRLPDAFNRQIRIRPNWETVP